MILLLSVLFACSIIALVVVALSARRVRVEALDLRRELRSEVEQSSELSRDAHRLQQAFDELPDGVVILHHDATVVVRNRVAQRFVGARDAEAVIELAITELARVATGGTRAERELELFGPPRRIMALDATPLRRRGDIIGAVVLVRDISESRRVEAMRRDFIANVSHELRTPVGALGLLAETIADETDERIMRQFAQQMEREAIRLGRIVEDLLDLSIIETDGTPTFEAVDVSDLVYAAVNKVRGAADVAQIPIRVAPCVEPLSVYGDRRQLVSAVYNLLDNAVKYSDRGAAIDIAATKSPTTNTVTIDVRDRGIGIPTRDLERVFERFYRVDRARSSETGGTGLGLSIVRHVIASHGGEVSLQSHEGEGSCFSLALPSAVAGGETLRGNDG